MVPLLVVLALAAAAGAATLLWRRRSPRRAAIDPFTLSEPWRRHVSAALSAQRRYLEIVRGTRQGPLRDRLTTIGAQVQQAVEQCADVARRGDDLDAALGRIDVASLDRQLAAAADDATRASLGAQLAAAGRIRTTRDDTDGRLRLLVTRMGELTALAAEVGVGVGEAESLGSGVDDVVTQLEGLRLALQEVEPPGRPATSP